MTNMNTSAPERLPPKRLPIVGVMGSGTSEHDDKAAPRLEEITAFIRAQWVR